MADLYHRYVIHSPTYDQEIEVSEAVNSGDERIIRITNTQDEESVDIHWSLFASLIKALEMIEDCK